MSELPPGWRVAFLADTVELQRGFDLPAHARRPGSFPVLTSGEGKGFHDEGPVAGPGFIVGRATNLGRPKWSSGDFWPHNTTMFAKDFKGNHPRWLFHLFEATDLSGFDSGSVQPMLNRNYIAQVKVAVPPFAEQKAIAEVLGALDDKIAANTALISAARQYALAISRVQTEKAALGNVVVHLTRQIQPAELADKVVDLFSLPAFDAGTGAERVPPSEIKSGKFLVQGSVLLVSKLNPRIPRMWPIDEDGSRVPKLASTEFVVLEPFACTPNVLWALLSQPDFTTALEGQVAGTSGSHQRVKPADLLATAIPDPRLISPQLHADVNAVLDPVSALLAENRTLAATRDALLPQLMSGRLRVRDVEAAASVAGV